MMISFIAVACSKLHLQPTDIAKMFLGYNPQTIWEGVILSHIYAPVRLPYSQFVTIILMP